MALRMLLVGVVACLGLNQPTLRGSDEAGRVGGAGSALGVGLIGALVEIGPIGSDCAAVPVETVAEVSTECAAEAALVGWPWSGCPGEAVAVVEAVPMSCVAGAEAAVCPGRIHEVEVEEEISAEVIVVEPTFEADPDAAFLVAVDSILDDFLTDRPIATIEEEVPPPPALEAEVIEPAIEAEPIATGLIEQSMPEPLYPGLVYELTPSNDDVIELAVPVPAGDSTISAPEGRVEDVTTAVRLTGQAIAAWGRIFVQTGPVRR